MSTVTLSSGKIVGYQIFGSDESDNVVLFIPGLPGTRDFCLTINENIDIKVIVIERPGIGLSSGMPESLTKWAKDAEEFLSLLSVNKFSLIGYSGGGPWSLALSALPSMKKRIVSFYSCSSIAPRAAANVYSGMPLAYKIAWWSARNFPWLVGFALRDSVSKFLKEPLKSMIDDWKGYGCKEDAEFFENDKFCQDLFLHCAKEMYEKGQVETEIAEHKIFGQDWDFELSNIGVKKVVVYQGEKDTGCTKPMGEYLAQKIPNSQFRLLSGKGHLWMFMDDCKLWNEMIEEISKDLKKELGSHSRKKTTSKSESKKTKKSTKSEKEEENIEDQEEILDEEEEVPKKNSKRKSTTTNKKSQKT